MSAITPAVPFEASSLYKTVLSVVIPDIILLPDKDFPFNDDISVVNPLEAAKIKDIMESAVELEVPNKVDYESGPNWGTIK